LRFRRRRKMDFSDVAEMLSHTPVYVWGLLAYLVWGGWKARTTYVVSWKLLPLLPIVMFCWSLYAVLARYDLLSLCLWALSVALGMWVGEQTTRRLRLRVDRTHKLVEISGSWTPLGLSMAIFALRYALSATQEMRPDLVGSPVLLALECGAAVVSGMFVGRLIGYWKRSKTAAHAALR
jgi:hypothetical protein